MQDAPQTPGKSADEAAQSTAENELIARKSGRAIDFDERWVPLEAIEHIFAVRFAEALTASAALSGEDDDAQHAFRLACKRLRYAIERNEIEIFGLNRTAEWLASMTDALGEAHDAIVLHAEAETCGAKSAARSLLKLRDTSVADARRLWTSGFEPGGAAQPLIHILTSTNAGVSDV